MVQAIIPTGEATGILSATHIYPGPVGVDIRVG